MSDIHQRFIIGAWQPERFIQRSAHNVRDIARFDIEARAGMWIKEAFREPGSPAESWVIVVQTRDGVRTDLFAGGSADEAAVVLDRILGLIVSFNGQNIALTAVAADFLARPINPPTPSALVA